MSHLGIEHYRHDALNAARVKYPGLSREDHEDIVQEAIANVLARLRKGPVADERSYLLRVVYTVGSRVLADRQRKHVSLDLPDGVDGIEGQIDRASLTPTPEEAVLAKAEREEIRQILAELRPEEVQALSLRALDRRRPAEIAEEMGWSPRRYRKLLEWGGRKLQAGVNRRKDEELLELMAAGLLEGDALRRAQLLAGTREGEQYLLALRTGRRPARLNGRETKRRVLPVARAEGARS